MMVLIIRHEIDVALLKEDGLDRAFHATTRHGTRKNHHQCFTMTHNDTLIPKLLHPFH